MVGEPARSRAALGDELLVLVGPTASGKTAAAIELARLLGAEIVSADSMQIYRGMDIGTAKPTIAELYRARFHLVDVADPTDPWTVSRWISAADQAISDIRVRGRVPILCGGTGLYVRALLDGWSLARAPADPGLRSQLQERLRKEGAEALHQSLSEVDPASAIRLHPNDTVRVVRALEVYAVTEISLSDHQERDRQELARRPARLFGLTLPRSELYRRIEHRVDTMIADGLEAEVRGLIAAGVGAEYAPMKSLGYKEMVQLISGELTLSETVSAIKQGTRRYAKRQQTWFNADGSIEWIDVTTLSSAEAAGRILRELSQESHAQGS